MSSPLRSISCSAQGTFAQELTRLAERGMMAVFHSDIQRLQPGEYLIHMPVRKPSQGTITIYYRE